MFVDRLEGEYSRLLGSYEIVTFKSVDECLDKAKYLLENETERDKIAAAGQKKTLENFTLQKGVMIWI